MSEASLGIVAGWIIFFGGLMVFWGSLRQAKAELVKYRDLATDADMEKIKKLWRGRFVTAGGATTAGDALEAFAAGSLAFARQKLLDNGVRNEAKDALNSATAWGLILLGSCVAMVAAAAQAVILSFPHI